MHDSGEHYNIGHPQKYVGALLHNAYEARDKASPRVKLPPAYLDNAIYAFPVDSCMWEYKDWTTDFDEKPAPAEHFVWLSGDFMPFCMDPGKPHIPPDFTLGLAEVSVWPA